MNVTGRVVSEPLETHTCPFSVLLHKKRDTYVFYARVSASNLRTSRLYLVTRVKSLDTTWPLCTAQNADFSKKRISSLLKYFIISTEIDNYSLGSGGKKLNIVIWRPGFGCGNLWLKCHLSLLCISRVSKTTGGINFGASCATWHGVTLPTSAVVFLIQFETLCCEL